MDKTTNEGLDRSLVKIYNLSKNSIQESPFILNNALYEIQPSSHRDPILFDETTSISYRIWKFNKFFDELENRTHISKDAIAKYDFKGDKPGDLSFKKGDKLKIIFTFIDEHENDNWLVGISETDGLKRKGFVPSNYLE